MKNRDQIYELKMKVLRPVFIGNGEQISKNEYYWDKNNNKVYVIDAQKVIDNLPARDRKQFMINAGKDPNVIKNQFKKQIERGEKSAILYSINEFLNDTTLNKIHCCIKDPYGKPYIPGSSIKGALRTAILSGYALESNFRVRKNDLNNGAIRTLDEEFSFNWKNLQVSDSDPLDQEVLVLTKQYDHYSKKAASKKVQEKKKMPVIRESIDWDVDILTRIKLLGINESNALTLDRIMRYIDTYNRYIEKVYQNKFYVSEDTTFNNSIIIGGGTGFISKTLNYPILGGVHQESVEAVQQILARKFKKHKHDKDYQRHGISPSRLRGVRVEQEQRLPLDAGVLQLEFMEITRT